MITTEFLDHTAKKWLYSYLADENEVNEVCEYLQKKNLKISIVTDKEDRSCSSGYNVFLEGINLSVNGFCFNGKYLLWHVRWFSKLKEISETDEFKQWVEKSLLFEQVKDYVIGKKSLIYKQNLEIEEALGGLNRTQ